MNIASDSIAKGVRGDAIFVLINLLARLSNKAARQRLGSMGTWPGQIPIVLCLLAEEGLSQKELIERTRIEQSTMAEHLDRMERDGLIHRARDEQDHRVFRIYLSDKVKDSSDWLKNDREESVKLYTSGISRKDLETCSKTLVKIMGNMEKYTKT
ncbi:MAG: MarR family winged helix-turn-helix transcriptional regulator [Rhodospirillales bacterium]